ncbi:MAG: glutamyl-tRNA reductase [Deltaproteobacteria bacterium]
MEIILVGMNHKSAPIEARERAVSCCGDVANVTVRLKKCSAIKEVFYLATCNRVEILAISDNANNASVAIGEVMGDDQSSLRYIYQGQDAVRHLFRVASSLDSMVIGEPQILGQLKDAYAQTLYHGGAGVILNKLLHHSFRVAKAVREKTRIAENPVSVSYAAVELAKRIFSKLEDKTVLLIGAGDMALLAARHLVSAGVKDIIFTNRTFTNALALAESFGGRAIAFEDLTANISNVDILISSTGATNYIITPTVINEALKRRKNHMLFIIDIALPRDVDPQVGKADSVYLYNIDDLQGIVDRNTALRHNEALVAEGIIALEVEKFNVWEKSLELVPTIVALRERMGSVVCQELNDASSWLNNLSDEDRVRVEYLANAIMNKFLHSPSRKLKEAQAGDMATSYATVLKDLFELE